MLQEDSIAKKYSDLLFSTEAKYKTVMNNYLKNDNIDKALYEQKKITTIEILNGILQMIKNTNIKNDSVANDNEYLYSKYVMIIDSLLQLWEQKKMINDEFNLVDSSNEESLKIEIAKHFKNIFKQYYNNIGLNKKLL